MNLLMKFKLTKALKQAALASKTEKRLLKKMILAKEIKTLRTKLGVLNKAATPAAKPQTAANQPEALDLPTVANEAVEPELVIPENAEVDTQSTATNEAVNVGNEEFFNYNEEGVSAKTRQKRNNAAIKIVEQIQNGELVNFDDQAL